MQRIEFMACDVRPRAQKDGSWDVLFESDENAASSVAMLTLMRQKLLRVTVEIVEDDE